MAFVRNEEHQATVSSFDILIPPGSLLIMFAEAYFDESGSHDGSPVLAVAGYLFTSRHVKRLETDWRKMLREHKLPYFRMSSCAHGARPFEKLDKSQRIEIEKCAIDLIQKHMSVGVAVSIAESEYNSWLPGHNPIGSAYTFCCWMALVGIRSWIDRNGWKDTKISYCFESGHRYQGEANDLMNKIFGHPILCEHYRYKSHSFIRKESVCAVQAADLYAWQHATFFKNRLSGKNKPRKDFEALLSNRKHEAFHGERWMLDELVFYQNNVASAIPFK